MDLNTEIIQLNRVGKTVARRLSKLGLKTAMDLLFYFPFRYEDYTKVTKIKDLKPGAKANIVGQIELIQNKRSYKKKMYITEALISDETELIKIIWFNQPFIAKNLKIGDMISLAGKANNDYGITSMISPIYEKITKDGQIHTAGFVPIYHLTENITQKQLRFLIKQIIPLAKQYSDPLPEEIKNRLKLLNLAVSLEKIHFPKNKTDIEKAHRRLAFNELFLMQIKSQIIKKERDKSKAESINFKEKETKEFVENLPFVLTNDQKKCSWQILKDIEKEKPMARLLNGDVGSGKTVVAVISMFNAVLNNKQAVLMAPTEILACQHFDVISKFLEKDKTIKIALFTNSQRKINTSPNKKIIRKGMIKIIKDGEADFIIGTHALVQEDVEFDRLCIDRAQRAGHNTTGSLFASDAFFPFAQRETDNDPFEGTELLVKAGCFGGVVTADGKNLPDVQDFFKRATCQVFYLDPEHRGFCRH